MSWLNGPLLALDTDAAEAHALGNGTPFTRQQHWPIIPAGLD